MSMGKKAGMKTMPMFRASLLAIGMLLAAGTAQAQSAGGSSPWSGLFGSGSGRSERQVVANLFGGRFSSQIETLLGRPLEDLLPPSGGVLVRPILPRPPGGPIVSAIPEPAAALLFAVGLGVAGGLRGSRGRRDA